jgi:putative GTP pyrophosphokinase
MVFFRKEIRMSQDSKIVSGDEMNRWVKDAMDEPTEETAGGAEAESAIIDKQAARAAAARRREVMLRMVEFKELLMRNACAIKEVRTKLEILNTEFALRYHRNPIHSINTRLKSMTSIGAKMEKYGKPFTVESIEENMHDIAGVRVICSYIDDIYTVAEALLKQDDVTYVSKKDYIKHPKPNGYRSLHLIIKVPVFFADKRQDMTVEVQIRTIAMDFWASLEHQLHYKENDQIPESVLARLHDCAESIDEVDREMLLIRRQVESIADKPTEDDILLERFGKIDLPIL